MVKLRCYKFKQRLRRIYGIFTVLEYRISFKGLLLVELHAHEGQNPRADLDVALILELVHWQSEIEHVYGLYDVGGGLFR